MNSVRIPANVDREDRLLAGLTARQLAWLAAGALLAAGLWAVGRPAVPAPVLAVMISPLATAAAALAVGRLDSLAADRLLLAALRHLRNPRRLVPAPEGIPSPPAWVGEAAPGPLPFPVAAIDDDGLLDLGGEGLAAVCRASSLNFGLRTPAEQEALVAALGRWLNALDAPVQIVLRAERVDLDAAVASLRGGAVGLPHPALEHAARQHAAFLLDLAARRDVLRRVVLVVFREVRQDGAADLLRRRVEESARALAAAGVTLLPLGADDTLAALAAAAVPDDGSRLTGHARPGAAIVGRAIT